MSTEAKKVKDITPELREALTNARIQIRQPPTESWIECQIKDLYETGDEKGTGIPVQSLEVYFPDDTETVRKFAIKGADAINLVFGNPTANGQLGNVTYAGDRPISVRLPMVDANKDEQYWFELKRQA